MTAFVVAVVSGASLTLFAFWIYIFLTKQGLGWLLTAAAVLSMIMGYMVPIIMRPFGHDADFLTCVGFAVFGLTGWFGVFLILGVLRFHWKIRNG